MKVKLTPLKPSVEAHSMIKLSYFDLGSSERRLGLEPVHQERCQLRRHGQELRRWPRVDLQPPGVEGHRSVGGCLLRHRKHRQVR